MQRERSRLVDVSETEIETESLWSRVIWRLVMFNELRVVLVATIFTILGLSIATYVDVSRDNSEPAVCRLRYEGDANDITEGVFQKLAKEAGWTLTHPEAPNCNRCADPKRFPLWLAPVDICNHFNFPQDHPLCNPATDNQDDSHVKVCATQEQINRAWADGGCHSTIESGNQSVTSLIVGYDGVLFCRRPSRHQCAHRKPTGSWKDDCDSGHGQGYEGLHHNTCKWTGKCDGNLTHKEFHYVHNDDRPVPCWVWNGTDLVGCSSECEAQNHNPPGPWKDTCTHVGYYGFTGDSNLGKCTLTGLCDGHRIRKEYNYQDPSCLYWNTDPTGLSSCYYQSPSCEARKPTGNWETSCQTDYYFHDFYDENKCGWTGMCGSKFTIAFFDLTYSFDEKDRPCWYWSSTANEIVAVSDEALKAYHNC